MKVVRYAVHSYPPISHFEITNLTDAVVLAGPNGVGKTTLLRGLLEVFQNPSFHSQVSVTVQATSPDEVSLWNGFSSLDSRDPAQQSILRGFLQRNQKRGQLRSGVLNFDSTRAFEQIQPYNWSWSFIDPFEEDIGWSASFAPTKHRFQDVVHAMVRKIRSQKEEIARQALLLKKGGSDSMSLVELEDPIGRFKEAFASLLPGKIMEDINEQDQMLRYRQSDQVLDFWRLSSGEREVVTVVFDFLLRNPKDCIVVFDEPELHLHPELSYRLLRTLQDVGERNQFIYCTHSPEIITANLDQSVIFVGPPKQDGTNQALIANEDEQFLDVMNALGQSIGVISLGRKIVLIEGTQRSLDKETYGSIVGSEFPEFVLVPIGGKASAFGFENAVKTVLSQTLWGVDFFILCDGDANATTKTGGSLFQGRMRQLSRYHLENYFLDEFVWTKVVDNLALPANSPLLDSKYIRDRLRTIAGTLVPYTVALRISNKYRLSFGNIDLMPKGTDNLSIEQLVKAIGAVAGQENKRCQEVLGEPALSDAIRLEYSNLQRSLENDDELWKTLIPGKRILKNFAREVSQDYGTMKRIFIRTAKQVANNPFQEIYEIFSSFASY